MALTADKKTEWMEGRDIVVKGDITAKIYAGALVMGSVGDGFAQTFMPASDASGYGVLGVALESKEAGQAQTLLVRTKGVFKFKTYGNQMMWTGVVPGADLLVVDDESVAPSGTTNNLVAGKFVKLDDDTNYVWVRIG